MNLLEDKIQFPGVYDSWGKCLKEVPSVLLCFEETLRKLKGEIQPLTRDHTSVLRKKVVTERFNEGTQE